MKRFYHTVFFTILVAGIGCAGEDAVFTDIVTETAGANCATGGLRISVGIDANNDGNLTSDEIDFTEYVCNGVDGADAVAQLTNVAAVLGGVNCASGGLRFDVGPDTNGNDVLDTEEIAFTNYVCNGEGELVSVTAEAAGVNCPLGGTRIDTGSDKDGSGVLDVEEIESTNYVCDGGVGEIVSAFDEVNVNVNVNMGAPQVTLQMATLNAPAAGTIYAIASVDAYCDTPGSGSGYECGSATTPAADACLRITTEAGTDPCLGDHPYVFLAPSTSDAVTRSATFSVPAGITTLFLEAADGDPGIPGEVGFWNRQLTLIYMPN